MTVPAPDFESTDLTDTGNWDPTGSPPVTSDQHGTNNTFDLDGVDDYVSKISSPTEFFTSGTAHTMQAWVNTSDTDEAHIFSERVSENGFFFMIGSTGKLLADVQTSSGNLLRSVSNTGLDLRDVKWHLMTWVVNNTTSSDLYVDGIEVTYSQHNNVFGAGWSGHAVNSATFKVGWGGGALQYMKGIISRPKLWRVALSASEVLEEFNNEVALINDDQFGGITPRITSLIRPLIRSRIYAD